MDGGVQVVAVGEPRRELRIVAGTALVDDQPTRDPCRQFGAGMPLDQVQREVDAGRDAGAAQQRPVVDEDAVLLDLRRRCGDS